MAYLDENGLEYVLEKLSTEFNKKSNTGHTHNDIYYTETEIDTKVDTLQAGVDEAIDTANIQVDWNQNDETAVDYVRNKPFYSVIEEVELLPKTTVTLEEDSGMFTAFLPFEFKFEEGKQYTVYWNDEKYQVVGVSLKDTVVIGNLYYAGLEGAEDTGEPFVLGGIPNGMLIVGGSAGSFSINIFEEGESIKTIDPKYLPDMDISTGMLVVITEDDAGYTANKTYQEILDAVVAGENVYAVVPEVTEEIMHLQQTIGLASALSGISTFATASNAVMFRDISNYHEVIIQEDGSIEYYQNQTFAYQSGFKELKATVNNIKSGTVVVKEAEHATSADSATTATTATACSGNAATATALTTSAGDSNTPVYFSGGKPVKCTSLDLNTSGSSASCTGNAATATKLATARTISLTGDVTGSVSFDGSRDASMEVAVANNSHEHARLVNGVYSNGRVTMLYNNETSFSLVPGETRDSDGTAVFLGVGGNPYAGLYTNFVTSGGHIEATSGNIVATNGLVQAKTQVYSKGELTADGALAVGGAATIDGNVSIGGITTVTQRIVPAKTNNVNLGLSDRRWMGIYSTSSVNVSSDLNVKKDLAEIDDRYIKLFDLVQPYAYRFIDGNSGRVHTGFISQYVEEAMEQVGLSDMDLGFFCKDALFKEIKDEDGNVIGQEPVLDEDGNQKYFYSLRYEEYIAIMTEKIKRMEQKHAEEKADFEARLSVLENKILSM